MPATITVFLNGQELQRYEIAKERILIGRIPENDIVIDHPTVSRKHAAIVKMGAAYQLQDLGSSSGTYVNAKKIASYFLNDADEVSIGQLVLRFNLPQPPQVGDSEMTMVVTNDDIKKQLALMHQAALAGKAPPPPGALAPAAPAPAAHAPAQAPQAAPQQAAPAPVPQPAAPAAAPLQAAPAASTGAGGGAGVAARQPLQAGPIAQTPQPAQVLQPAPSTQPVAPPPATQPMAPPVMKPAPAAPALSFTPSPAPAPAPAPAAPAPAPAAPSAARPPEPAAAQAPAMPAVQTPAAPATPPAPPAKAAPPPPPKPPAPPPLPPSMIAPLSEPSLLTPSMAPVAQKAPAPEVHPLLSGQPKAAMPAAPQQPPAPASPSGPHAGVSRAATDSALLATVKGPFLGGKALPIELPPAAAAPQAPAPQPARPPAPPVAPAAPEKLPLPPTRPEFPPGAFEPTILSQGKPVPVTPPPHAAAGGAGAPAGGGGVRQPAPPPQPAYGTKPDLLTDDFDAGKTVPPMAIGGLNKATSSYPKSQMPAGPAPAPGVIPTPLPPTQGQTSPPGQVQIDQLLQPLHSRPKTQPMPPPVPPQPAPHAPAAPPPIQPLQPVSPQQQATTAAAPAVRGGVGAPGALFAQAQAGGWGDMTPPIAPTDDEKQWGMLAAILSLFCLIGAILGLVLRPQSKFVKFYSMQAILFACVGITFAIALSIMVMLISWVVPFFGILFIPVSLLINLAFLVAVVIQALKANKGILYKLPLIGGYAYNLSYGK
ncbi:MAG: FHA domain-containing protein [Planctomycetes bacterium]|nr:FHA domain-containing protein [Planctomycetota bacterium]